MPLNTNFVACFVPASCKTQSLEFPWDQIHGTVGSRLAQSARGLLGTSRVYSVQNFASSHGPWKACQMAWCGSCYMLHLNNQILILQPTEEDGFRVEREEDEARFKEAQDGDNLICPFQWDVYHFRNLKGRGSHDSIPADWSLSMCIQRAILDLLWAREPSTVNVNMRVCVKVVVIDRQLGLAS